MTNDFNQLADIMVDWCEYDLDALGPRGAAGNAREALQCMIFTLTQDAEARRLFGGLLAEARREWIAAHPE